MKIFIALILIIHGFAHLVGFLVPWKIRKFKEMPFKTTLLNGRIDAGKVGIKIIGSLWLAICLLFFFSAFLLITNNPLWFTIIIITILFSIIMCILGLPDSKIGILANIFLLLLLFILLGIDWIILNWIKIFNLNK